MRRPHARNPFAYGRDLGPAELVDRRDELAAVAGAIQRQGTLFLIGPRRYGKTSILRAASTLAEADGTSVFRYDAQAFPTIADLAERLAADTVRRLTPSIDRAAVRAKTRVAVIIDEFQEVVEHGGPSAEEQIRAAIQRHRHVAYVFAGSKTRMLADMISNASRPFYRLGAVHFLGAIPRPDFTAFIEDAFRHSGISPRMPESAPFLTSPLTSRTTCRRSPARAGTALSPHVPMNGRGTHQWWIPRS